MSAKPCAGCQKLVIFAKDRDTGQTVVLTNQAALWRSVPSKNGPLVVREPSLLSTHYCSQPSQPAAEMPEPKTHFSEPKDIWSASE